MLTVPVSTAPVNPMMAYSSAYVFGQEDASAGRLCVPEMYFLNRPAQMAYAEGFASVNGHNPTTVQILGYQADVAFEADLDDLFEIAQEQDSAPVYADEWGAREVAELARYALRQPGGIATLVGDLRVQARKPIVAGECAVNRRHWIVTDGNGDVLAEERSLFQAIHKVAR